MWIIHAQQEGIRGGQITTTLGSQQPPRRVQVEREASAILFERIEGDVQFWGQGVVVRVDETPFTKRHRRGEELEFVKYTATIGEISRFRPAKLLSELRFSLERVTRYQDPRVHFFRRYGRLSSHDAQVVGGGLIHWSRTAVGMLAEVLPREDQLEVVRSWYDTEEEAPTYRALGRLMVSFLDTKYGGFSQLLIASCELADKLGVESLTVGSERERGVDSATDVELISLRADAHDFEQGWAVASNPFRQMLERAQEEIFEEKITDAAAVRELILNR